MNICTIIARNYLAHARVLAESFSRQHPQGTCWVLVVDGAKGYVDTAAEPFELVDVGRIGLPDLDRMAAAYDVTELSTAVKPWLLRHLLDRDGVETITYLDPDIWIADPIDRVWELAAEQGIVLTPHLTAPLPRDGLRPREEDIMIAGAYNLGFISLGAGEPATQLLDWWSERLERHCVVEPADGLFVDQRWIDLVPGIWPRTAILRDPGYNLAYWNLPTHRLEIDGERYLVDGEPLRFLHFSGFDPRRPERLSKHQDRIEVSEDSALDRACREYAGRLLAAGFEQVRAWPYGWDTLPNGVRVDPFVRDLYCQAEQLGALRGPVFERRGAERFTEFMREAPGGGVSRYARAVYDSRPDLQRAFPEVEARDADAFEYWLGESAASLGIAPALVTHRPTYVPEAERNGSPVDEEGRPGLNLCGYLDSELGVGEAARQVRSALEASEVAVAPVEVPVEEARMPGAFAELEDDDHPFDVNLVCVNADMLPAVARTAPSALFENRRSAGLWFWEVERFPERWRDSFDHLDEVWTASEFVAEALRPLAPIPVRTIRVPVTPARPDELSREQLSMPEGFCFLFVFDYRSVVRRKNPLAVVEAFRRAFEPGEGASLLIKSVAGESHSEAAAELAAAAAGHPDVHLLDEVLSAAEKNAMIASCDCYVSLHRSEGLGLTMAEAMYFGRPVIATGYSGNLDFMDERNSFLVDYDLEPIGRGAEPYSPAANWAEPSIEHASRLMRQVFDDPEAAARVGERAARAIRDRHSPEAAGALLEERLAELRGPGAGTVAGGREIDSRAGGGAPLPEAPTAREGRARLQYLLSIEKPPPRGKGRAKAWLKRAYLRLLRPYAGHQREIDLSLRDSIDEIGAEVGAAERRMAAAGEANLEALREEVESLRRQLGVAANGNGHGEPARNGERTRL